MLRLGFDAKRLFHNYTGLGNYSRTLLKNLAFYYPDHEYFLYSPKIKENQITKHFLDTSLFTVQTATKKPGAYWRSFAIKDQLQAHNIQLYHGLSHEIPFGIKDTGIKSIVTIHDLIFKQYPAQYGFLDRQIYDFKFKYACQNADKIIAISESTKRDLIKYYQVASDKIEVIYQTCHERFMQTPSTASFEALKQKYRLPATYMLYVGSVIERKNLLNIVKAMQQLPESIKLPLVVVGKGGKYLEYVQEFLRRERIEKWFLFLDVTSEELPALYQASSLFIYPSICEGFGIPILEAIFSKTPIITSNRSSLPEAGGPHSCQVDPTDPEQIALAIRNTLTNEDLRKKMIQKSFEYAQQFKGDILSARLLNLYQKVIA